MKKLITKYFLILLGFILTSFFLGWRFLRTRLPREIPFNLRELGFYLLALVCIRYSFSLKSLIIKKEPNPDTSYLISEFIKFIYQPLIAFDNFIKDMSFNKKNIDYNILRFLKWFLTVDCFKYNIMFEIIPRIILISTLCIDVFYFNCMFLLYKVIWVSILILIGKYVIYTLKNLKEMCRNKLDYMVQSFLCDEMSIEDAVTVDEFINEQSLNLACDLPVADSGPVSSIKYIHEYKENHGITGNLNKEERKKYYNGLLSMRDKVLYLYAIFHNYDYEKNKKFYKYFNIITYGLYLLCWSYVLFISFHKLQGISFTLSIIDYMEPFSGLFI